MGTASAVWSTIHDLVVGRAQPDLSYRRSPTGNPVVQGTHPTCGIKWETWQTTTGPGLKIRTGFLPWEQSWLKRLTNFTRICG